MNFLKNPDLAKINPLNPKLGSMCQTLLSRLQVKGHRTGFSVPIKTKYLTLSIRIFCKNLKYHFNPIFNTCNQIQF